MKSFLSSVAITVLAMALATPTIAGPLKPQCIAADSDWLVHIDVQGLANSKLVQFLLENSEELNISLDGIEGMKGEIGLDPLKDIKDITIQGQGQPDADGPKFVAIVTATNAVDELIKKIKEQGDAYSEQEIDGYMISSFHDGDDTMYFRVHSGAGNEDRVILISREGDRLTKAIDVVEGKSPSIRAGESGLLKSLPRPGSLIFIAAQHPAWSGLQNGNADEHEPMSAVVRDAKAAVFAFGESGENTFADLFIATATSETATNMADILRGLTAIGKMAAANDPEFAPFKSVIDSITFKSDASAITVSWQQRTSDVSSLLKKLAKENGVEQREDTNGGK